jgi:hypothetical protein
VNFATSDGQRPFLEAHTGLRHWKKEWHKLLASDLFRKPITSWDSPSALGLFMGFDCIVFPPIANKAKLYGPNFQCTADYCATQPTTFLVINGNQGAQTERASIWLQSSSLCSFGGINGFRWQRQRTQNEVEPMMGDSHKRIGLVRGLYAPWLY